MSWFRGGIPALENNATSAEGSYAGIKRSTTPFWRSTVPLTIGPTAAGAFTRAMAEEMAGLVQDIQRRDDYGYYVNASEGRHRICQEGIVRGEYINGVWQEIDTDLLVDEGL